MSLLVNGQNLLQNGDFSQGREHWRTDEWQKDFVVEADADSSRGNVLAMHRTARFADWSDTNMAAQGVSLEEPYQGAFRFGCDAKVTDNAEGYPEVRVELAYTDGTYNREHAFRINAGKNWERKEFVIPRGHAPVTHVNVVVTYRGIKTAAFDNFTLTCEEQQADLTLNNAFAGNNLFGNSGVSFSAETNEQLNCTIQLLNADGNVLQTQVCSGRTMQALFPQSAGAANLRVTLQEPNGPASRTTEYPLAPVADVPFRPYCVFTADSMDRIMPGQMPINDGKQPVTLALAGNEHEAFQIALRRYPGTDIGDVAVEFSDFVSESGDKLSPEDLTFFQIGFLEVKPFTPHPANPWINPGWWPDALLPVSKVKIPDDNTFGIWIDVFAKPGTSAGIYSGTVTLIPDKAESYTIPVSIEVYNFSLPDRPALATAFDIDWNDVKEVYGPERFPEMKKLYNAYIADRRLSPSPLYARELEDPAELEFIAPKVNTINVAKPIDANVDVEALKEQVEKIRNSSFAKDAYFYGFDEFKDEVRDQVRDAFGKLKAAYPDIHTFATSTAVDITETAMRDLNLDWLCVMIDYYDEAKAAKVRSENPDLQVWGYISFQPGYPYVNYMLEYPLIESRLFAWQAYNYDMDGYLYWGLNQYWQGGCKAATRKLVDPEEGPYTHWSKRTGADGQIFAELNGDGKILYYGVNGPIGSIVLENIRDGIEDFDYLKLAQDQSKAKEIGKAISPSFTEFTRSSAELRNARQELAKLIAEK